MTYTEMYQQNKIAINCYHYYNSCMKFIKLYIYGANTAFEIHILVMHNKKKKRRKKKRRRRKKKNRRKKEEEV